jgi:uncharacterized glyoxalase superfamily protein PhnB
MDCAEPDERSQPTATLFGLSEPVDDIDIHYERARAAGAEVIHELADTSYGSGDSIARDPGGRVCAFGTYRPNP